VVVTVSNAKGVLARVASAITSAEADINFVNMPDEVSGQETADSLCHCRARHHPYRGGITQLTPFAIGDESRPCDFWLCAGHSPSQQPLTAQLR
jgi:hypothetical protein